MMSEQGNVSPSIDLGVSLLQDYEALAICKHNLRKTLSRKVAAVL
jgi:hypothetical protein